MGPCGRRRLEQEAVCGCWQVQEVRGEASEGLAMESVGT